MNNRNPNKENTYSNLSAWCEQYHKDSGIKIHPSSVPTDLILEDVLGYIAHLRSNVNMLIHGIDNALARIDTLEADLLLAKAEILELQNPLKKATKNEKGNSKGVA